MRTTLLPHQCQAVGWMRRRERQADGGQCGGGVLADDMGLGKTVDCIALVVETYSEAAHHVAKLGLTPHERQRRPHGSAAAPGQGGQGGQEDMKRIPCVSERRNPPDQHRNSSATLIVTPLSVMDQWHAQWKQHAAGADVAIYHGKNRAKQLGDLLIREAAFFSSFPSRSSTAVCPAKRHQDGAQEMDEEEEEEEEEEESQANQESQESQANQANQKSHESQEKREKREKREKIRERARCARASF